VTTITDSADEDVVIGLTMLPDVYGIGVRLSAEVSVSETEVDWDRMAEEVGVTTSLSEE
jgi:hypothetical protein